ncbi:MAG: RdgB/HAM1 family non-canonical purine NTP pyrophosphatase [Anaerolineaceae bacterium]|nr:RdgB/HAM1 family non-canonical purine NTP pyrophosphatase [Anaerolineaceae bacterium]
MEKTLLVASANPGKVREIKAILNSPELTILSAKDAGIKLNVAETGQTYEENAWLKADAYQKASGMIVLADDSGLEVDALNGEPGIYSARYAAIPNASDADRRRYLLEQLKGKADPWPAHFHCTAVLASPQGHLALAEGRCDGLIISEERGTGGFGYDPIFFIPEESGTMAELTEERKNRISHRARALQALLPTIQKLFQLD